MPLHGFLRTPDDDPKIKFYHFGQNGFANLWFTFVLLSAVDVDLPASHLVFKFWRFDYIWRMGFVIETTGKGKGVGTSIWSAVDSIGRR